MGDSQADIAALEREAVPVHFPGMVSSWPAVRLWRGETGLQRLIELAGSAHVDAMVSPAAAGSLAVGDMQHLILLGTTLREFLEGSLERQLAERQPPGAGGLRLYLAQCPLLAAAPGGSTAGGGGTTGSCSCGTSAAALASLQSAPLAPLMADLGLPPPLAAPAAPPLSQVNFWASLAPTRSSLHYDPYLNLLCVVAGRKRVVLVPPACQHHLRPQPLTHESANHSAADLAHPDLQRFPGLGAALAAARRFEVAPGDALFIPEGWWHQVDSDEGTLAVNFWWEGGVSRQLGGHMDRYYFRRLAQSLLEQQKAAALAALPRCNLLAAAAVLLPAEDHHHQQQQHDSPSSKLAAALSGEPGELAALTREEQVAAVSLLAAAVAQHQQAGAGRAPPPVIAAVVATLSAHSAQALLDVLLELCRQQPQAAAHLLLHSLDPAGWELLSGCFEQLQEELAEAGSATAAEEAVGAVCDELYSVVEDRQALLDAILQRKEAFSRQALRAVLETELGGAL